MVAQDSHPSVLPSLVQNVEGWFRPVSCGQLRRALLANCLRTRVRAEPWTLSFQEAGVGERCSISPAVACRNKLVERTSEQLCKIMDEAEEVVPVATQEWALTAVKLAPRSRKKTCLGTRVFVPGDGDSQALGAELDKLSATLKRLLLDDPSSDDIGIAVTAEDQADEEENEAELLRDRLRQYRYVRKIEAPLPPLVPLDGSRRGPRTVKSRDQVEANMTTQRLTWGRTRLERARHRACEEAARATKAQRKREETQADVTRRAALRTDLWEFRVHTSTMQTRQAVKPRPWGTSVLGSEAKRLAATI